MTAEIPENLRPVAVRHRLPDVRDGLVRKVAVDGVVIYLRTGVYPDGALGEIFATVDDGDSTMRGLLDGVCIAVSMGLQSGIPIDAFCDKFEHTRFAPAGFTNDPDRMTASSPLDAIFAFLRRTYGAQAREAAKKAAETPAASPADSAESAAPPDDAASECSVVRRLRADPDASLIALAWVRRHCRCAGCAAERARKRAEAMSR